MDISTPRHKKYLSSKCARAELIWDVTGGSKFSNADRLLALREESRDGQENRDDFNDAKLRGLVRDIDSTDPHIILRTKVIGSWLNTQVNTVTGEVLAAMECHGFLCASYDVTPTNLHSKCDGCGTSFNVHPALICSKVGLVIACHNKVNDKLIYLVKQAFLSGKFLRKTPHPSGS